MNMLIIADDLSGAADCAIGFVCAGLRTVVALNPAQVTGDAQVIAVDTDSRRLSAGEAAECASAAYQALIRPGQRLYKKIDSTLRGNWAAEVAALQRRAGLAIVAPAFPATGRTLRDGRVLVNGVPLENTDTWQLENAGRPADVDDMLVAAGLSTARVGIERLRGQPAQLVRHLHELRRQGIQALIVDAETSDDLRILADVTLHLEPPFFWVGSGGLAREITHLPELLQASTPAAATLRNGTGPVLVMVGSLSAVSERQCAVLKARSAIAELIVPSAVLRPGPASDAWSTWATRIARHLGGGEDLLLRIGRDEAFDPAEGAHLSNMLAAMVKPGFAQVSGLVATGGETARAMLMAVGIESLELVTEIEAGVAVGRPLVMEHGHRPGIVTKAGAFGSEQALYAAWLHLSADSGSGAPLHALKGSRSVL
ncbi:four-carbon acid sugar kinase family protein [Pseudomonas gingeri]|uniref:four-carbon acid sugar kinase family protein n=1 Tax=Pseudomonas gingeri TaxID=117681 RepID=UPI0015A41C78|nr:four-carbon acid sugar kinase family protein [Pseudomonas gingeri]NWA06013.1 four-carbon acid sugar kinase family protein [Pseudomonas gingeri]